MRIQTKYTLGLIAFSLVPLAIAMGGGYTWSRKALLVIERERLETLGTLKVAQLRGDIEAHAQRYPRNLPRLKGYQPDGVFSRHR